MTSVPAGILTLNTGSSGVKFTLFSAESRLLCLMEGRLDWQHLPDVHLTVKGSQGYQGLSQTTKATHRSAAIGILMAWIKETGKCIHITAVGHRIVHGGSDHHSPLRLTPELTGQLLALGRLDPEHVPQEIALIHAMTAHFPELPQIACFDTAFHHELPRVAQLLAIPRRFEQEGVRRYGFHGLSYEWLMEELARQAGEHAAAGRVILAHLGNGVSVAAVSAGKPMDTTMAFTPAAGVCMGTRSGDIDPGLVAWMLETGGMDVEQFNHMVNFESGMLGISETSADMQTLLASEDHDIRAAEAIALFCYQIRKCIGAYAAVLGGVDTLVFAGGIGENAPVIRSRICEGLGFLGVHIDETLNAANATLVSLPDSTVTTRVIHTDEARMIARSVWRNLQS